MINFLLWKLCWNDFLNFIDLKYDVLIWCHWIDLPSSKKDLKIFGKPLHQVISLTDWMYPPQICMLKPCSLTVPCIGSRWWDFWKVIMIRWGNEGVALMNGISAIIRVKREFTSSLWHVKIQWEVCSLKPGQGSSTRTWPCWLPDLGVRSSDPRTVRNQFLLFICLPVYGTLL